MGLVLLLLVWCWGAVGQVTVYGGVVVPGVLRAAGGTPGGNLSLAEGLLQKPCCCWLAWSGFGFSHQEKMAMLSFGKSVPA